ncbi:MAG: metal ABC transporter permease [Bacteroidales bacterium]|nr:metal ABC transporter permease [Bacteroidales bacterium]
MTGLEFMFAPLVASLLLIFITVYFGIHVIEREIIFIDIALAQIAALGSAVSLVIKNISGEAAGHDHDSRTLLAYLFCVGAAFLFTILKNKKIRIPLEAVIGIAYAVATTSAVIILDKGAGSDVHIHDMLTGSILWVTWPQIIRLSVVVVLTGGFHYIFRERFRKVTLSYHGVDTGLKNPKLWDFIFYMTFGIVIVEAVNIGGILTIFAFLIIPSSISALFAKRWTTRILIGFLVGGISTLLGLYLSWNMDIPCSPAIILFLGAGLLVAVGLRAINKLFSHQRQSR